jgi:hypothetical protein
MGHTKPSSPIACGGVMKRTSVYTLIAVVSSGILWASPSLCCYAEAYGSIAELTCRGITAIAVKSVENVRLVQATPEAQGYGTVPGGWGTPSGYGTVPGGWGTPSGYGTVPGGWGTPSGYGPAQAPSASQESGSEGPAAGEQVTSRRSGSSPRSGTSNESGSPARPGVRQ